ncbi:class IV lanthionine synthetase LanL [Streptomyces sp. NPDC056480]|uniref:class IV lanthionine synthetase LanL n=1 Tax=Streptomyces sp. NPDC056480 TaxID=3345833 RepID=UPI0036988210
MADAVILVDVLHAVLDRCGGQRWAVKPTDSWCYVTPPVSRSRAHGWKLHVSATPLSAPLVLARAAEILVRAGCSFKFATDIRQVSQLVGQWHDRGGSGKFITVYPKDDVQFRALAEELHHATEGLAGPGINSDKRLRPGSLVHYRYGEISGGEPVFTDDGTYKRRMVGPDGTAVKDERNAWFSPPAWAKPPFPDVSVEVAQTPQSVLLGGRYRVRGAIRHANKGGVYRADDERTDTPVVVKQARAHVGAGLDGTDVRDQLRREARIMQDLAPLQVTPGFVDLFEEMGDLFMVQEEIPGKTLKAFAAERQHDGTLFAAEAINMARRLASVMQTFHDSGYLIRDLKPHNVMVSPLGDIRVIDVKYVCENAVECYPAGTPGYMAPEAANTRDKFGVPDAAADCFSLGVTIFTMITSLAPDLLSPQDGNREGTLAHIAVSHPTLTGFVDIILGLTDPDPQARWTLGQAREFLDNPPATLRGRVAKAVDDTHLDNLIDDLIRQLRDGMSPGESNLWKPSKQAQADESDPLTAWNGAAGILSTLTRIATLRKDDKDLRDTVATAAMWINQRLFTIPRLLPGLAFGRSGTAWALYDAGRLLDDDTLQKRALELAARLPVTWPSPDITHGLSGAGMAHIHLWQATSEQHLLDRALVCADAVLAAAHHKGDDWSWPIPTDTDSALAGQDVYGFAHGIAGVGAFLLAAAEVAEHSRPGSGTRYLEAALGAGDTLTRAALHNECTGVCWPNTVGDGRPVQGRHWCSGVGGIGSFLIRLATVTGDQRFAELASQAATAAADKPWGHLAGACCGLSGAGNFLLDMADHTGHDRYRRIAGNLATVVHAMLRSTTPDRRAELDYQIGAAGVLAFLFRLRHGGPHPWMPATQRLRRDASSSPPWRVNNHPPHQKEVTE